MKCFRHNILELWEKMKKGDANALGKVYDIFIDELFSYGIKITNDKNIVKDCIHDLFLDLYKYKTKLTSPNNIKRYLFISLKRKIVKKVTDRNKILSIDTSHDIMGRECYSKSLEEEIIEMEFLDERIIKLVASLNLLSEKQKLVLFLRFNEDRGYEEIAQIMNISVQTSRTNVYRALKALKTTLVSVVLFFVEIV